MTHFFKKHWVVLAAFALSFLLTIFISPENAVIAQTTLTAVSETPNGAEFSEEVGIAEDMPAIAAPTLNFGF
jgi:hypothetical protein